MPITKRQEAHRALELLEEYHSKLSLTDDRALREAIERVIMIFKRRLFQALLDIQEFYEQTLLDDSKSMAQKIYETNRMADQWEINPPIRLGSGGAGVSGGDFQEQKRKMKTDVVVTTSTRIHTKPPPAPRKSPSIQARSVVEMSRPTANGINNHDQQHHQHQQHRESQPLITTSTTSAQTFVDEFEYEEIVLEKSTSGLGFSLAGGVDNPRYPNDPSIYVTKVITGGAADQDGRLRKNDAILRVNSMDFTTVQHALAVDTLKKSGNKVQLRVRRNRGRCITPESITAFGQQDGSLTRKTERIELNKGTKGLGFSIAGGLGNEHTPGDPGIYVTRIIDGGAAQLDGRLLVGDQILAVGNTSFENVTHETAVAALKATSDRVVLTIAIAPSASSSSTIPQNQIDSATSSYGAVDRQIIQSHVVEENDGRKQAAGDQSPPSGIKRGGSGSGGGIPAPPSATGYVSGLVPNKEGPSEITRVPRRVVLTKGRAGLGFNIVGGEDGEGIYISYILPGGVAELSGALFKGDQLLEVNEANLTRATHEQAAGALKNSGQRVNLSVQYQPEAYARFESKINQLREELIHQGQQPYRPSAVAQMPYQHQTPMPKRELYVRALYDYEPNRDSGLPSRGLAFIYGDILHVTNASDDEWWQARRVVADGVEEGYGIVPSKKRVEKKERARRKQVNFSGAQLGVSEKLSGSKKSLTLSRRFPFMKSKERISEESDVEKPTEEIVHSYEIVERRHLNYARPVVILGPLKDRINDDLLSEFPDRYGSCVPHTSRPPREHESDGRDYHFVSREQMESDIAGHKFIEAGQYNQNLYGTSVESVRKVAEAGRHTILDVSGNALKRLQSAALFPIAVFIKPFSASQLSEWNRRLSDEEAERQYHQALQLEQEYADYLTAIVQGNTPEDVYARIKQIIREQSAPVVWVPSEDRL